MSVELSVAAVFPHGTPLNQPNLGGEGGIRTHGADKPAQRLSSSKILMTVRAGQ
jgi:hypothetical protein